MFKRRTAHGSYIISNYSVHHCWEMRPLQCFYNYNFSNWVISDKIYFCVLYCVFTKYYTTEKHRLAKIRLKMCRHRNQCGLIRLSLIQQKARNKHNKLANRKTYKTICSVSTSSSEHVGKGTTGRNRGLRAFIFIKLWLLAISALNFQFSLVVLPIFYVLSSKTFCLLPETGVRM